MYYFLGVAITLILSILMLKYSKEGKELLNKTKLTNSIEELILVLFVCAIVFPIFWMYVVVRWLLK